MSPTPCAQLEYVLQSVEAWPAASSSVGVATATETIATIGDTRGVYPLASVTKLLVAMAVWVAIEEESVSLSDSAGPDNSTVQHLLAHASGLPLEGTVPMVPPGNRRVYSNTGYRVLGAHLERATGLSVATYLDEAVVSPLGLQATKLIGEPHAGAQSNLDDMLVFACQLMNPTIVSNETLANATATQWPELDGVLPGFGRHRPNPWGLGPEIRGDKSPHWTGKANSPQTFGHFGKSGTFVWVDPVAGLAVVALTDEPFGEWAVDAWPRLSDALLTAWR